MSKMTVTVEVYKCDHVEGGEPCTSEGNRQAIKECSMCGKDICGRHYETVSITSTRGRVSLTYFFCYDHAEEFVQTLIKTLGDTRPVPYAGMAK